MKKNIFNRLTFSFVLFAFAIMLTLVGCGKTETPVPTPSTPQAETPKPERPDIILATTTSTQDSGLLDVLIPDFEKKPDIKLKPLLLAQGLL